MKSDNSIHLCNTELYCQPRKFLQAPSQSSPKHYWQLLFLDLLFLCFCNQWGKQSWEKLNNLIIVSKPKDLGLSIFRVHFLMLFFSLCCSGVLYQCSIRCPLRAHLPTNIFKLCSKMQLNFLETVWPFLGVLWRLVRQVQNCLVQG